MSKANNIGPRQDFAEGTGLVETHADTAKPVKHSKSDALLLRAFGWKQDGKWRVMGSAVDTDEGTPSLWAHLERQGYVKKNTRSGRGMLGHYFSRAITDEGRAHLETLA